MCGRAGPGVVKGETFIAVSLLGPELRKETSDRLTARPTARIL